VLVITRRQNESVVIGEGIEVSIVRVDKDSVRLGITAPPSIPVHRREVYEQICKENLFAAVTCGMAQRLAGRLRRLQAGARPPGRFDAPVPASIQAPCDDTVAPGERVVEPGK